MEKQIMTNEKKVLTFDITVQDGKVSIVTSAKGGVFEFIETLGIIELLRAAQIENYYQQYGPTKKTD